jgi:hypothetical protein
MKVHIDIPLDLGSHHQDVFRISKLVTASGEQTAWETIAETSAISAVTYLADLEPGQYQKVLETTTGQFLSSNTFTITADAKYIDEAGKIFSIAEDGTLLEQNDQQESS